MALFEVPGWTVSEKPIPGPSRTSNNKRKHRLAGSDVAVEKLNNASVNVEKLMAKLGGSISEENTRKKRKRSKIAVEKPATTRVLVPNDVGARLDTTGEDPVEGIKCSDGDTGVSRKKSKAKAKATAKIEGKQPTHGSRPHSKELSEQSSGLTALQSDMKHSLDGARFRWINETLYKSNSKDAHKMMQDNPDMFSEYHTGFRHQVHSWPSNPVTHYISSLSAYPSRTVIADLGCGDAAIARDLIPKGFIVLSFDLVSQNSFVVEADICGTLPLPGDGASPDGNTGNTAAQIVDVAVFALSLMGINWPNSIREAWRILKLGGELKIAEVASRFKDIEEFIAVVSSIGFKLRSKNSENTHFTLFEFIKVKREDKDTKGWNKILSRGSVLKPCEYKRR